MASWADEISAIIEKNITGFGAQNNFNRQRRHRHHGTGRYRTRLWPARC